MIGEVLGKCRIESVLGSGGMGVVYKAAHLSLGVPVAVKVVRPELADFGEAVDRLLQEAQLIARLRHPNVVRVYDVGQHGDLRYVVMELLEGVELQKLFHDRAPLDLPEFFEIFQPLADGMGAAHGAGIVHRDVKPGNVIIVEGQKPVLTDFGIAASWTGDVRMTQDGNVLGTPAYMSPEQARGDPDVDGRADVFALGIMMYEALTGRLPQNASNQLQLLRRRLDEDIPDVSQARHDLPQALAEVVTKATARDRRRRYSSGTELAKALATVQHELRPSQGGVSASSEPPRPSSYAVRSLQLPHDEALPITDGVDLRYTDLLAVVRAAEGAPSGFGLIVIHYSGRAHVLLFREGLLEGAFEWSPAAVEPIDFDYVLSEYTQSPEGFVDALSVSESYSKTLLTVFTHRPKVARMRAAFVDLFALVEYLRDGRASGVVKIESAGTIGFVVLRDGELSKILCDPWFQDTGAMKGVVGLSEVLREHPDAHIDVYSFEDAPVDQPAVEGADIPLELEEAQRLVAFVDEALRASGAALEKLFGLGSRPILDKHLRLAAEEQPAFLSGLELGEDYSLAPAVVMARIGDMPRTGRRRLVSDAFYALLDQRGRALRDSLRAKRKRRKALAEYGSIWRRHQPGLADGAFRNALSALFADLEAIR